MPEADMRRVFEKPPKIRVERGLAAYELNTTAAGRASVIEDMAPIGKLHLPGERQIGTRTGIAMHAREVAASSDFQPQEVDPVQTTRSDAQLLERKHY